MALYRMDEAARRSTSEFHGMLAANKCSQAMSKSYSAANDEGRSRKFSKHKNIITSKVRVVYVYEPEIIKTDPENFRSLVQRLTGKSSHESRERKRKTNHKGPASELIAAEIGKENIENTLYHTDLPPAMKSKNPKFSSEDWSVFPEGFSDMDMILPSLMDQGLLHQIPLILPRLMNQGLSSDIITAGAGSENLEYTFYGHDQLPITEYKTTNCSSESCTVSSKVFSDTEMVFPSLMNQGVLEEIPLVRNNSPFCDMYDLSGATNGPRNIMSLG